MENSPHHTQSGRRASQNGFHGLAFLFWGFLWRVVLVHIDVEAAFCVYRRSEYWQRLDDDFDDE